MFKTPQKSFAVFALIAANLVTYVYTSLLSRSFLITSLPVLYTFGQVNTLVMSGCYWQLFTSMFIHVNLLHLLINMIFLVFFGVRAEESLGKPMFIFAYFASGLLGNLFTLLLMDPYGLTVSAGASGAIFGILGAYVAYLGKAYGSSVWTAVVYSFLILILNISGGVNVLAHLGGLIAGLAIGYIKARDRKPDEEQWR